MVTAAHQPFVSARAKLRRAQKHTEELRQQLLSFLGARIMPVEVTDKLVTWELVPKDEVPPDLEPILGDAVHNLRSALDHLAASLAIMNEQSPKGVYFPFAESEDQLDQMIRWRKFDRASPSAVALLKELKPYRGGNLALRGIHDLDVLDKHHSLIPAYAFVYPEDAVAGPFFTKWFPMGPGFGAGCSRPLGTFPRYMSQEPEPIPLKVHMRFKAAPFAGEYVTPTLRSLAKLVGDIIDAFAALYEREGADIPRA